MKLKLSLLNIAILPFLSTAVIANETQIETIEVTGDFHKESIQTLSASASVVTAEDISTRGASYLDEILNSAANVNFTAGASRGRFVQIRGVGLRSQFVDPINPSVAFLVDGINYSGLGGSALLFDVEHVAVYRGPQGTRFGADAMAGVIDVTTAKASQDSELKIKLGAGNYNSYEAGIAAATGLTDTTAIRGSFYTRESDGYVDNIYLKRPTQNQDEQVARLKINSDWSDNLSTQLTLHSIDIDNGYDGFTLDNTRQSVADQPGKDTLQSDALSLHADYHGFSAFDLATTVSVLNADSLYSYDEDWSCDDAGQPTLCDAGLHPEAYKSFDSYAREREQGQFETLLSGKDKLWALGVIAQQRDTDLTRDYYGVFNSYFEMSNHALFGQVVTPLSDKTDLITGLRIEAFKGDYSDSNAIVRSIRDTLVGGKVALEYQVVPRTMIYTSLSRGFKAGGVNSEAIANSNDPILAVPESNFTFDPEYLWNAEFGVKGQSEDKRHTVRVSSFYMYRDNMQLKGWRDGKDENDAVKFVGFTTNASSGRNYGFEAEGIFNYTEQLTFNYSFGYLRTHIDRYSVKPSKVDPVISLDGRAQAQSPKYQYSLSAVYALSDAINASLTFEGKDNYYHSDSHMYQADNSNLINASITYYGNNWQLTAWGRNLADRETTVRGFAFGNDPREGAKGYERRSYVQFGEPRVVGLTFNYTL